ncbi:hypothetical protein DPMN_111729 [Dreissena polymorpha]|uniref:Uncharacterized protein n=1 Tax=Dreissena polymorpha TaxID=45954 RepID=A0A9D4QP40_DREPO|nr:hypothetical protein DPMN_111729 [Dreissena polymorpha]
MICYVRTKGRTNVRTDGRRNEGTDERRNGRISELTNEQTDGLGRVSMHPCPRSGSAFRVRVPYTDTEYLRVREKSLTERFFTDANRGRKMRTRNADTWNRSNRFQPVRFFADTDTRKRNADAETWKPGLNEEGTDGRMYSMRFR